jgi:alkylhydroperoxidase/carboxymuconolactone decarboxylase family protein YurZ
MLDQPWFVQKLAESDPELYRQVSQSIAAATGPGALDEKTKLLIILAIDAFKGSPPGVKAVAEQARRAGATEPEIRETMRIACLVSSMDCLNASAHAF